MSRSGIRTSRRPVHPLAERAASRLLASFRPRQLSRDQLCCTHPLLQMRRRVLLIPRRLRPRSRGSSPTHHQHTRRVPPASITHRSGQLSRFRSLHIVQHLHILRVMCMNRSNLSSICTTASLNYEVSSASDDATRKYSRSISQLTQTTSTSTHRHHSQHRHTSNFRTHLNPSRIALI